MNTKNQLKPGVWVAVMDQGLLMLQQFAPPGSKPNNVGRIKEIAPDGQFVIEFPIGNDKMSEHSQIAPYPKSLLVFMSEDAPGFYKKQV